MKALSLLFATTSISLCSSTGNVDSADNQKCNKLLLEKVENLTPYEFTTIKDMIKIEDVEGASITSYNVDYEYSAESILFLVLYDGDISGEAKAWFVNVGEKVYIDDISFSKSTTNQNRISVEYRDFSGHSCRENLALR